MYRFLVIVCLMSCFFTTLHTAVREQPQVPSELNMRVQELCKQVFYFVLEKVQDDSDEDINIIYVAEVVGYMDIVISEDVLKKKILQVLAQLAQRSNMNVQELARCIMMLVAFVSDYGYISNRLLCLVWNRSFLSPARLKLCSYVSLIDDFPTEEHILHWIKVVLPELERDINTMCDAIPLRNPLNKPPKGLLEKALKSIEGCSLL